MDRRPSWDYQQIQNFEDSSNLNTAVLFKCTRNDTALSAFFVFFYTMERGPPVSLFLESLKCGGIIMEYDPVNMGRRIATIRKECGFSQLDLAETLYVSDSYISKIENGIREPSLTFMASFAEITGTSLEYLIVGKKEVSDVKALLKNAIVALSDLEKEL